MQPHRPVKLPDPMLSPMLIARRRPDQRTRVVHVFGSEPDRTVTSVRPQRLFSRVCSHRSVVHDRVSKGQQIPEEALWHRPQLSSAGFCH